MQVETKKVSELIDSTYFSFNARWSPDGSQVVFNSRRDGNTDVWLVNMNTKETRQLTHDPTDENHFGFSYDGKLIGYNTRGGNERHLFALSITGGEPIQLTVNPDSEWMPSWSPTENKVAYYSTYDGRMTDIWTVDVGASPIQRTFSDGEEFGPVFSPDGKFIVYRSSEVGYTVQSLSDNATKNIAPLWAQIGWPTVWLKDGNSILFPANAGAEQLYKVSTDGGESSKLTNDKKSESHPAISPDGRQILFETDRYPNQESAIMVNDASGTTPERLNPTQEIPSAEFKPKWSADGKSVFYIYSKGGSYRSANVWKRTLEGNSTPVQVTDVGGISNFILAGNDLILAYDSADLYKSIIIKFNLNEKRYSTLVKNAANNIPVSVSPDGKSFLFQSNQSGTVKLYEQPVAGTGAVPLSINLNASWGGSYRPDGSEIVFVSSGNTEGFPDIYILDRNSGEVTRITKSKAAESNPVFTTDGKHIIYNANTASTDVWKVDIEQYTREANKSPKP